MSDDTENGQGRRGTQSPVERPGRDRILRWSEQGHCFGRHQCPLLHMRHPLRKFIVLRPSPCKFESLDVDSKSDFQRSSDLRVTYSPISSGSCPSHFCLARHNKDARSLFELRVWAWLQSYSWPIPSMLMVVIEVVVTT